MLRAWVAEVVVIAARTYPITMEDPLDVKPTPKCLVVKRFVKVLESVNADICQYR